MNRNNTSAFLVMATLLIVLLGSCLRTGEERAELDLLVGTTETGGARLVVEDGLATFREASPGAVALWAQAPRLNLEVEAGGAGELTRVWSIRVENCMPGAVATLLAEDGTEVEVTAQAGEWPTDKRWSFELPGEGTYSLTIGPEDSDTEEPWRFAMLSDIQEDVDDVQDVFSRINEDESLRFVVSTGDLTRMGARDQLMRFQRELRSLRVPFYSTVGNHELGNQAELWHELYGRFNYQFKFKGVYMTLVDSGNASIDPVVYGWLEDWLYEARDDVHVFLTHIAPIDPVGTRNGSFRHRKEAAKLLAMLAEGRMDMTVYGHVHSYYAFSNAGIPAFISGGGGAIPERLDGIERHFLAVDVTPGRRIDQVSLVRVD